MDANGVDFSEPPIDTTSIGHFMRGLSRGKDASGVEQSLKRVHELHAAIYKKFHATARAQIQELQSLMQRQREQKAQDVETARKDLAEIRERIKLVETHVDVSEQVPERPWTPLSYLLVAACVLATLILWTISINVIAGYLINSEQAQFLPPNEWRAYLVSALPLAFPIVLEIGYRFLPEKVRRPYFYTALVLTGLAGLVWLVTLLMANQAAPLDLTFGGAGAVGADHSAVRAVNTGAQIFAELTASFIIISQAARIVDDHQGAQWRIVGQAANPTHKNFEQQIQSAQSSLATLEAELNDLEERCASERQRLAATAIRLDNGLEVYCQRAMAEAHSWLAKDEGGRNA